MDKYASIFAEAFIKKCFEAGLSEKAASDLLQSQIVVATDAECPGFAQGYTKVAAQHPGVLIPLPTPAMFEKRAGKGKLLMGLGGLLGLGGAAAIGGKKMYDSSDPNRMAESLPTLAGYNPNLAKAEQQVTNAYQDPLFDLNHQAAGESRKLRELDSAVDGLAPGASSALIDSQRMRGDRHSASNRRQDYLDRLDNSSAINRDTMREMRERSQARERRSQAWYTAPYRFWNKQVLGRDPYNESRIRDLRAQEEIAGRLRRENELSLTLLNNDSGRIPNRPETKRVSTFEIEE